MFVIITFVFYQVFLKLLSFHRFLSGIPSISICGTDKTVLYTVGQKTALKTYAISASGAITSDAVNSSASQYLCCFLAKEKKLIVYDLKNKIMLVSDDLKVSVA
jgi:hypothetical protein